MAKRKNSVAYVRLDGNNKPIPGTLIFRQKKPYGKFAKMVDPAGDLCCAAPRNSCGSRYSQDLVTYVNPEININGFNAVASDADAFCNVYSLYRLNYNDEGLFSNVIIEKRDSSNTVLWCKRLIEPVESVDAYPSMIKTDLNGDVVVVCEANVFKLSGVDGSIIWSKQYGNPLGLPGDGDIWIDYLAAITFDSNNDIYVGGTVYENEMLPPPESFMVQNKYGLILKLDGSNGSILASKYLDITPRVAPAYTYFQESYEIQVAYDGSLRVVFNYGDNVLPSGNVNRFIVAKLTSSLVPVWSKQVNIPASEKPYIYATTIVVDDEGSTICPTEQGYVLKLDENGNALWFNYYEDPDGYWPGEVGSLDANGNIICSWSSSFPETSTFYARTITKLSGVDGSVMFNYNIFYPGKNMNYWFGYTPRQSNYIHGGDTLYMASSTYTIDGFIQKFPVNQSIPDGTYENYVVFSKPMIVTPILDGVVTKDITLTTFVVPTFEDYVFTSVNDTNLVHTITNIP